MTIDPEAQFALHLQRRLFELMDLPSDSWKDISGVMLHREHDTGLIRVQVIKFGTKTKHFTISTHEEN